MKRTWITLILLLALITGLWADIAQRLEKELVPLIEKDMARFSISGVSLAFVSEGKTIWKKGFGFADREKKIPATPETVYRIASISKLFNALGIMKLEEAGKLDIDADIKTYLPFMSFKNPFPETGIITLRHLLSHRADIPRECPVGHYFDDSEPSLEATIKSIAGSSLIYPPGSRAKYSNIGVGIAGYILEKISANDFAKYEKEFILRPLGMNSSSFLLEGAISEKLAKGYMRDREGRQWDAPHFRFGYLPAANLYSTVLDLSCFINFVLDEGKPLLSPETFKEMLRVQFAEREDARGFGLGFSISKMHGRRSVGHNGALYGFSSNLLILPDDKLGFTILNNLEGANSFNFKVSLIALGIALEEKTGTKILNIPATIDVPSSELKRYEGKYEREGMPLWLTLRTEKLYLEPYGQRKQLTPIGKGEFITDDLLGYGERVSIVEENNLVKGVKLNNQFYKKVKEIEIKTPPEWEKLLGEYGPDYNIMKIYVKDGKLTVLIEWFDEYPLQPLGGLRFRYPDYGMYLGEEIVFKEKEGKITEAEMALVNFNKRK